MAAPRLRLRRGTTAPSGSIALSGEPFVDTSAGNFYIASAASTFIHIGGSSYVDRVGESLVAATATTSGTVKFKSRTDSSGGGSITFDSTDTANDSTYTWPDAPGGNRILQSNSSGDLSWVSQTSGYAGWTIGADDANTETVSSGHSIDFVGGTGVTTSYDTTSNELTISSNGTLADVAGLAVTNGGIIVGDGSNFVLESGATARTSLGLAIGTNVQAQNAILEDLAGLTQTANTLPYFDSTTTAATTAISAFGRSLIDDTDAAAARTTLGVDLAGQDNSTPVTLVTSTADYLSISGQAITLGQVDLTTDVTGTLPIANGGTGATTASAARTSLGCASSADNSEDVTLAGSLNYLTLSNQEITVGSVDLSTDVTGSLPAASVGNGIANSQLTNSSITVSDGTNSTATSLGGTITFSGTTGEIEVGESGGTVTVGLPTDVTITGNLTVNGTTTTVNTTNTTVSDAILELQQGLGPSVAPTSDSGLIVNRGSLDNVFIGYDEGATAFVAGTTAITGSGSDAAPTPVAFLSLAYKVTDTAGTNQVVIGYNTSSSQRELQNIVVDAGTY